MISRVAVASSVVILVAALVLASQRSDASYTREDVIEAFNAQGYELAEVNGAGWTGYAPLAPAPGTFLFPRPIDRAHFYVFVARNDRQARSSSRLSQKSDAGQMRSICSRATSCSARMHRLLPRVSRPPSACEYELRCIRSIPRHDGSDDRLGHVGARVGRAERPNPATMQASRT
jgi:hypothetical protein